MNRNQEGLAVFAAAIILLVFMLYRVVPPANVVTVDQHATSVPTPPTPQSTWTNVWHPKDCAKAGFKPNMIFHYNGWTAQTTYDAHGCPAILVLVPLKGATPSATPTPNPRGHQ